MATMIKTWFSAAKPAPESITSPAKPDPQLINLTITPSHFSYSISGRGKPFTITIEANKENNIHLPAGFTLASVGVDTSFAGLTFFDATSGEAVERTEPDAEQEGLWEMVSHQEAIPHRAALKVAHVLGEHSKGLELHAGHMYKVGVRVEDVKGGKGWKMVTGGGAFFMVVE
jgi:hypothetical protein